MTCYHYRCGFVGKCSRKNAREKAKEGRAGKSKLLAHKLMYISPNYTIHSWYMCNTLKS